MGQVFFTSSLVTAAILAALAVSFAMAGAVHLTKLRSQGYMHIIFYVMLLLAALPNLLSGRDLTTTELSFLEPAELARPLLLVYVQPLASLFILLVAGERLMTYWLKRSTGTPLLPGLALAFIVFWAGTVGFTAFLGAHPFVSHDYVYPLLIGVAATLSTNEESDCAFRASRNALLLFMLAGLLLIPIQPTWVLDRAYTQGLLPGIPRVAGLAAHAVLLGLLAQLALLCLLAQPYKHVWLNRFAWATGLAVLFLAQSKSSWVSFVVCATCIVVVRGSSSFSRRIADPLRPEVGVLSMVVFMALLLAMALLLMFGDINHKLSGFFESTEGAQLVSLTGRDQIWAIAFDEWQRNPLFGYGLTLWDASFRLSIGMPNATHAHNQFMDTLSRSGTIGAIALLIYSVVLLVLSIRYAKASGGLTLALFLALAIRSLSEVPLYLLGYGAEFITHVLLLMSLAGMVGVERHRRAQKIAQLNEGYEGIQSAGNSLTGSARLKQ